CLRSSASSGDHSETWGEAGQTLAEFPVGLGRVVGRKWSISPTSWCAPCKISHLGRERDPEGAAHSLAYQVRIQTGL
ncbi:hypothetical protein BaRGS_00023292, partial [Batillaria attramentaria]